MLGWLLNSFKVLALTGGYKDFQRLDEGTKSAWSEVINQYLCRADLSPNVVAKVKAWRGTGTSGGWGALPCLAL